MSRLLLVEFLVLDKLEREEDRSKSNKLGDNTKEETKSN